AAEIEELIDRDAEIRQAVESLEASTRSIRNDFLGEIEEEPVPDKWLKLIEAGERKPGLTEHSSARGAMIAGSVLCSVVLALCALTYVNLIEIRTLRHELALVDDQAIAPISGGHQQAAGGIAQTTAIADDLGSAKSSSATVQPTDLNQRLALAAASLKDSDPQAEAMPGIKTTIALQQIETLRAALTKASDPIQLIAAEHRLLDYQLDDRLPMIGQAALEPILSGIWERPLAVPNLKQEGFIFKGARLVAINDRPVAHLVYRNADGQALGLWMTPAEESWLIKAPRDRDDGLNLLVWSDISTSYLMVSLLQRSRLESIKGNLQHQEGEVGK
ncbi:MAG: anti-sigma factor family protein, partial [Geminicoccaceae bacterium]